MQCGTGVDSDITVAIRQRSGNHQIAVIDIPYTAIHQPSRAQVPDPFLVNAPVLASG